MARSRTVAPWQVGLGLAASAAACLLASCDRAASIDDRAAAIGDEAAPIQIKAATHDKPPPSPRYYGGRSRAEALSTSGLPLRFDLVCEHDPRVVDPEFPVSRKIVDLEIMKYCYPRECELRGASEIVQLTEERLIFYQSPSLVQSLRLRDHVFESLSPEDEFVIGRGQCRVEPFSGFPPRLPRWEAVRPHPDDHTTYPFVSNE